MPNQEPVFYFAKQNITKDPDEETDLVAKMPHIVSRSPRGVGKINIINLAIGANISKAEETAQVEAIRAQ